jgi:hypothetical protein
MEVLEDQWRVCGTRFRTQDGSQPFEDEGTGNNRRAGKVYVI